MEKYSPAMERARNLFFHTPVKDIPNRAKLFLKILSEKYGFCGEIALTGYCHYAQMDEGLECTEIDYKLTDRSIYKDIPDIKEPVSPTARIESIDKLD